MSGEVTDWWDRLVIAALHFGPTAMLAGFWRLSRERRQAAEDRGRRQAEHDAMWEWWKRTHDTRRAV